MGDWEKQMCRYLIRTIISLIHGKPRFLRRLHLSDFKFTGTQLPILTMVDPHSLHDTNKLAFHSLSTWYFKEAIHGLSFLFPHRLLQQQQIHIINTHTHTHTHRVGGRESYMSLITITIPQKTNLLRHQLENNTNSDNAIMILSQAVCCDDKKTPKKALIVCKINRNSTNFPPHEVLGAFG